MTAMHVIRSMVALCLLAAYLAGFIRLTRYLQPGMPSLINAGEAPGLADTVPPLPAETPAAPAAPYEAEASRPGINTATNKPKQQISIGTTDNPFPLLD